MAVEQPILEQIELPFQSGYDYGMGVDLLTGSPRALAAKGRPRARGHKTVALTVDRIKRSSDLERMLGVDFSAEAAAVLGAAVKARLRFVDEVAVEADSLFVVIRLEVLQAMRSITRPMISEEAAQTAAEQPEAFADQFGNSFVRGIRSGGLFVGALRIDTETTEESRELAAELKAALTGGVASGSAKSRFRQLKREYEGKLSVRLYVVGDVPNLRITNSGDPVELLDMAQKLLDAFDDPEKAGHSQADYEVMLAPYEILGPEVPRPGPEVMAALDVIRECVRDRADLRDNVNTLRLIVEHPERYNFSNGASLEDIQAAVERGGADIDLLTQCAEQAARDPASAQPPDAYAKANGREFPQFEMPALLPVGIAPGETVVPDFSRCEDWGAVEELADEERLVADEEVLRERSRKFEVRGQRPEAGAMVPENTHVIVTTVRWNPDPWSDPRRFLRQRISN